MTTQPKVRMNRRQNLCHNCDGLRRIFGSNNQQEATAEISLRSERVWVNKNHMDTEKNFDDSVKSADVVWDRTLKTSASEEIYRRTISLMSQLISNDIHKLNEMKPSADLDPA